ncbi:MAG: hypothetical protein ACRBCT_08735 [Alphaproteobacteria bacterium]
MDREFSRHKNARTTRILSEDPAQAINEMMETINVMRALYVRENECLEASDARSFLELQQEKMETAQKYQRSITEIMTRRDEIKQADPELKDRLAELYGAFSEDLQRNQSVLSRMQKTTDRLKQTISRATREAVQKQSALNYGKSGALNNDPKKIVSSGLIETA